MILRELLNPLTWFSTDKPGSETRITELSEARIRHSYYQGIAGIRGSLVAAFIMTIALWNDVSHMRLLLWLACYITACGTGEALTRAFNKANPHEEAMFPWGRRFLILAVTGGLLWGLAPIFLFPKQSVLSQAMLTFVLGGMSIGIATSHGAMKEAYVPFILLVYVPLIGRYFYEGDHVHLNMAMLLLVFMIYLIGYSGRMYRTVLDALVLRSENKALVDDLIQRKASADKLNEALRSEMDERTRAEALLRQSERKYRQLFEISPDAMTVHSEGKILLANQAAATLLNATHPDALVGKSLWDFVEGDFIELTREQIRQVEHQKRAVEATELRLVALDKTTHDVEIASVPSTYKETPAVLSVARDVTQAKRAEQRLKASLEEKEILLREIHHRVKNNLQIISSLLKLQSKFVGSKSVEDFFSDSETRLQSMALLHERLYQSEDLTNIDVRAYVGALLPNLLQSYGGKEKHITFENSVETTYLGLDTAIPCGLIVNELVSNCLKHAFPDGRQGKVEVSLTPLEKQYRLLISDDGVGLPLDVDLPNPHTLGLRLVNALVRQLHGQVCVDRSCGTEYRIVFDELTPNRTRPPWSGKA